MACLQLKYLKKSENHLTVVYRKKRISKAKRKKQKKANFKEVEYYAFGAPLPGMTWSANSYREGFNGKEKDDEIYGQGNFLDYGLRSYDPRLAKFWGVDPLHAKFPYLSVYQFAGNTPIWAIDLDGGETKIVVQREIGSTKHIRILDYNDVKNKKLLNNDVEYKSGPNQVSTVKKDVVIINEDKNGSRISVEEADKLDPNQEKVFNAEPVEHGKINGTSRYKDNSNAGNPQLEGKDQKGSNVELERREGVVNEDGSVTPTPPDTWNNWIERENKKGNTLDLDKGKIVPGWDKNTAPQPSAPKKTSNTSNDGGAKQSKTIQNGSSDAKLSNPVQKGSGDAKIDNQ